MAKDDAAAPAAPKSTDTAPRAPQGITLRFLQTGDRKKDLHPYFGERVKMIDPKSLVRADGEAPFLAIPILQRPGEYAVKQVDPVHAAEMLCCDKATGAPSTYRLATDAEVAAYKAEAKKRAETPVKQQR